MKAFILSCLGAFSTLHVFSQDIKSDIKVVTDCTVVFDVSIEDQKADPNLIQAMKGATKTVYIRGSKVRSDLATQNFLQTTIYDSKTDTSIILREIGANKYISYWGSQKRKDQFKKYDGIQLKQTGERKVILGYDCQQMIAKLPDGSTYNIFYSSSMVPSNSQFEYQFKDVPGFVLEYEAMSEDGKTRVRYSANKISLVPVAAAKFDIPKAGYRVLD